MPFLQLEICQTPSSQDLSGIGESSKIVPTLTENCRLGCFWRHSNRRWLARYRGLGWLQIGQVTTPSGQRISTIYWWQLSGLAKNSMAAWSVVGVSMPTSLLNPLCLVNYIITVSRETGIS